MVKYSNFHKSSLIEDTFKRKWQGHIVTHPLLSLVVSTRDKSYLKRNKPQSEKGNESCCTRSKELEEKFVLEDTLYAWIISPRKEDGSFTYS
jgi:hypothetical protein